jgi:hypothetical protein
MLKIELDAGIARDAIRKAIQSLEDMTPIYSLIGEHLVEVHRRRFIDGKDPEGKAWAARARPLWSDIGGWAMAGYTGRFGGISAFCVSRLTASSADAGQVVGPRTRSPGNPTLRSNRTGRATAARISPCHTCGLAPVPTS